MKWTIGEIAEMQWDMTKTGMPLELTVVSVQIVFVSSSMVIAHPSGLTESKRNMYIGIAMLSEMYADVEYKFNPETGEQLPGTMYVYPAKLIKLGKQIYN